MQNPSDFDEFDLSAGQDSRERNNNVYVVSEENLELVEEKEKEFLEIVDYVMIFVM